MGASTGIEESAGRFKKYASVVTNELMGLGDQILQLPYEESESGELIAPSDPNEAMSLGSLSGVPSVAWPVRCTFWQGPEK